MTGEELLKSVFIIFYQGDQLRTRVKKICESLKVIAQVYPLESPFGHFRLYLVISNDFLENYSSTGNSEKSKMLACFEL